MKNQWLLWFFIIGVVVVVLFAFNYQGNNEYVSLTDIFPDNEIEKVPDVEYEYVDEEVREDDSYAATSEPGDAAAVNPMPETAKQETASPVVASAKANKAQEAKAVVASIEKAPNFAKVPFTIQVSSFKNKGQAEAGLKKVKDSGYPGHLVQRDLGDKGTWYRIYIGSFDTKEQADKYLSKVKNDYKDSFIIAPK